jgi:hypothetical protein
MTEKRYHANDLISKPLAGAVQRKKTGSWTIFFSLEEQSLYIVPSDYPTRNRFLRSHEKGGTPVISKWISVDGMSDEYNITY